MSWNCGGWSRGGFNAKKAKDISEYKPDILVIQECTKTAFDVLKSTWKHKNWYGDDKENSNQGIGVFSNKYQFEFTPDFNRNFRYVVPYRITGGKKSFILFIVWMKEQVGNDGYHIHVFQALDYYKIDASIPLMFIGDFNTGANCQNKWYKNLEDRLNANQLYNCAKGEKKCKLTFFGQQGHVIDDFCFASAKMANNATCKVIDTAELRKLSDHCPLIVDFDW
ncbi:endonuclease/exonuclease/phosphatase family protein [Treponema endosymbiont of Eucomonympha sp.]|uniref:endonuclease/exonuclease/phosphatase family protein n=1 Tax=Treponema endosymbiont of Eucomonympha sp. TaxID=1580831 RepID=UPI0016508238|nr:endonuclease/exonuclease/phosphatase family protein [Treponema endosymbiont of Eucomonympha sp.]